MQWHRLRRGSLHPTPRRSQRRLTPFFSSLLDFRPQAFASRTAAERFCYQGPGGWPGTVKISPFWFSVSRSRLFPVRLHFYGTKGYVEESSRAHAGHSAFTIETGGFRLLCDFGQNRKGLLKKIAPDAIFVSHAHPDHAWGLEEGTDIPVYASAITHEITAALSIENRVTL